MTAYKYPSKIVEKLAPAIAELTERGYLQSTSFEPDAADTPMVTFRFGRSVPIGAPALPAAPSSFDADPAPATGMPRKGPSEPQERAQTAETDFPRLMPDLGAIGQGFAPFAPTERDLRLDRSSSNSGRGRAPRN